MSSEPPESSFPTYAEMTQTAAWMDTARAPIGDALETALLTIEQSASGRYAESVVLGVGGMGKVVLARDTRIGRDVERTVLARAVALHLEDRVLVHENRTVVF